MAEHNVFLAWRIAMSDLRGTKRGLVTFVVCLALGVAAITGSDAINTAMKQGLNNDAQSLLGGDLQIRLTHREATAKELASIHLLGDVSALVEMRSMARTRSTSARRTQSLVELKAVTSAYPLFGDVEVDLGSRGVHRDLDSLLAFDGQHWGAVVDANLLSRLDLELGDEISIGAQTLQVRGTVAFEPDRVATFANFGPRVFLTLDAMRETELLQRGSLVRYLYNVRLADELTFNQARARLLVEFPNAGWQIRGLRDTVQGFGTILDDITLFFVLAGFTTLLVGGIGVANAVRSYLSTRAATIAIMKCVGASTATVFIIYIIQVALLTFVGIGIGVAVGLCVPVLVERFFGSELPGTMSFAISLGATYRAVVFGVLIASLFAWWPLAQARCTNPNSLLRSDIDVPDARPPAWERAGMAVVALLLIAFALVTSENRRITIGFIVAAVVSILILRTAAIAIKALARKIQAKNMSVIRGRPVSRLAVANLHRHGSATTSVVLSLGLGLTVLVAIALIETNLKEKIIGRLPDSAPSHFYIDIQKDQVDAFRDLAASLPSLSRTQLAPMIRGRIAKVNDVPVQKLSIDPEVAWAFEGDRGLSFATTPPINAKIVEGSWWSAATEQENLVSMDAAIARGVGLGVGDTITINVLGRDVTATVANLREIEWQTAQMNFTFVFNPPALRGAPVTYIATVYANDQGAMAFENAVAAQFPNVTSISVREAIGRMNQLLTAAAAVIRAVAAIALVAGILVLASAIATGQVRRIYESVVLKVLGAERIDVIKAFAFEYVLLGLSTAVFAVLAGALGAWSVIRFVMRTDYSFYPVVALAIVAIAIFMTFGAGFAGIYRALGTRPSKFLRNE